MVLSSTFSIAAAAGHREQNPGGTVREWFVAAVGGVGRVLLVVLAVLPAWCFGCVLPGTRPWLLGAILVILGCVLVGMSLAGRLAGLPWAVVPLLGALGLGAFQLMPLDAEVLSKVSPRAVELRETLDWPGTAAEKAMFASLGVEARSSRQPASLYPAMTRRELVLLSLVVGVFVGGAVFFRTPTAQMWLCGAMAINGALLSFQYIVQLLTHGANWRTGWKETGSAVIPGLGIALGPLVNRNNAGGYLNLCLAGAMALLLWSSGRLHSEGRGRWELQISAIAMAGLIVAGVFCTMSRGAMVSMLAGMTALMTAWAWRRGNWLWWGGLVAAGGVGLLAWVGTTHLVYARFATLFSLSAVQEGRLVNWAAAFRAVPDFWLLGSGLGTYGYIYRLYERPTLSGWCDHAENQAVEALVSGGVIGLGLLVAMVVLVGFGVWRMQQGRDAGRSLAFAWGVGFALVSQAIHSLVDFGLSIPSNAVLFALLCGAVMGGAVEMASWRRWANGAARTWIPKLAGVSVVLVVLTACTWGWAEARRTVSVETALRHASGRPIDENTPPEWIRSRIDELAAALTENEDHAEAQWRASQMWSGLYRVSLFAQLRAAAAESVKNRELWAATSLVRVHRQAHVASIALSDEPLRQWREEANHREYLMPALRRALAARGGCPLLVDPHLAIAQLCGLVALPRSDEVELERTRRLAPENAELRYWTGLLELQAGRPELACRDWRRLLELEEATSRRGEEVLRIATSQLPAWQVAERLLPDRPASLLNVARKWYGGVAQGETRQAIASRIRSVVDRPGYGEAEQSYYRGAACELCGAVGEAIEHYERAVELNPRANAWRFHLAVLLHNEGRNDEAHEQARVCAQQAPSKAEYRTLLQSIHRARLAAKAS